MNLMIKYKHSYTISYIFLLLLFRNCNGMAKDLKQKLTKNLADLITSMISNGNISTHPSGLDINPTLSKKFDTLASQFVSQFELQELYALASSTNPSQMQETSGYAQMYNIIYKLFYLVFINKHYLIARKKRLFDPTIYKESTAGTTQTLCGLIRDLYYNHTNHQQHNCFMAIPITEEFGYPELVFIFQQIKKLGIAKHIKLLTCYNPSTETKYSFDPQTGELAGIQNGKISAAPIFFNTYQCSRGVQNPNPKSLDFSVKFQLKISEFGYALY